MHSTKCQKTHRILDAEFDWQCGSRVIIFANTLAEVFCTMFCFLNRKLSNTSSEHYSTVQSTCMTMDLKMNQLLRTVVTKILPGRSYVIPLCISCLNLGLTRCSIYMLYHNKHQH